MKYRTVSSSKRVSLDKLEREGVLTQDQAKKVDALCNSLDGNLEKMESLLARVSILTGHMNRMMAEANSTMRTKGIPVLFDSADFDKRLKEISKTALSLVRQVGVMSTEETLLVNTDMTRRASFQKRKARRQMLSRTRPYRRAAVGDTNANGSIRWHEYDHALVIWDLTNAGKKGKKVEKVTLYDTDMVRDTSIQKMIGALISTLKRSDYKKALRRAEMIVEAASDRGISYPKIEKHIVKGVEVAPAGFSPFKVHTSEFTIDADWDRYTVRDLRDQMNLPVCYNKGKKDVKRFYRWVQDNWSRIKRLTFNELTSLMMKEGFNFRQYCSMD